MPSSAPLKNRIRVRTLIVRRMVIAKLLPQKSKDFGCCKLCDAEVFRIDTFAVLLDVLEENKDKRNPGLSECITPCSWALKVFSRLPTSHCFRWFQMSVTLSLGWWKSLATSAALPNHSEKLSSERSCLWLAGYDRSACVHQRCDTVAAKGSETDSVSARETQTVGRGNLRAWFS